MGLASRINVRNLIVDFDRFVIALSRTHSNPIQPMPFTGEPNQINHKRHTHPGKTAQYDPQEKRSRFVVKTNATDFHHQDTRQPSQEK